VTDATLKRRSVRAARLGYGGFAVANAFAFPSRTPAVMKRQADPIGEHSDAEIRVLLLLVQDVLCGWGRMEPILVEPHPYCHL